MLFTVYGIMAMHKSSKKVHNGGMEDMENIIISRFRNTQDSDKRKSQVSPQTYWK